ncbi:Disease resistance protein [Citrus sinensis]|uniref:disease resistance protein At4g27190-like isoform X1 n=1 Tax=Citrus sinensis TaxID=2711 RepID=UPI0021979279|nr:disease resistance protein At4g27190-like isoform X1 [Citrus sinensis]XP_052298674.1 disease resistance protein At4g27190-like isoform X1 [Citrus sinensis]KAH9686633.1 Disease resistance protein [Citrus sinensis]
MVESIVTVVLEFLKCLAPPTERRFGYLRNYKANGENLKAEIDKLKDERRSIQHRVSEAERKGEKIEEKVEKWLVRANNTIEQSAKFIDDEETTNKRCLMGLCPNLKTRYQLSKEAETKVKAIVELKEEAGKFDDRISYRTIPEDIWLKSHKGYETFESRLSTLKAIQNALIDVDVGIIGVYGMGGIGKTTLVKEFARRAIEDKLYDMVAFSEVTQSPDIKKVQEDIAETLGLQLSEEAESRRASRLYERLTNEKKILVILDNIWKPLDLGTIGIPFGVEHRGCKLLFTTRDLDVLLRMESEKNFSIGILNEQEAWRLFKIMAGDYVENRELESTATSVAKACGGLPIALTTVAKALRKKELPVWKNALQELQTPSEASFDEGVPAEAYSTIELSYKYLRGEQLKKTFLLCSLITPAPIMDLFKYSMGLGVFKSVHKLEDAHNKLDAWVHQLRDSCLLLEDGGSKYFSMHDVVRDVAISIACRDKIGFVVRNEDDWKWPNADELKKYLAISLKDSIINDIPEGSESLQLELLVMSPKNSFAVPNIPENFFKRTKKLRVLDFNGMRLLSLPSSIGLLVNLQALCLNQSILGGIDIAIIGKLENLEILSFLQSDIVELPKALGQLTKLRLLDLTDCFRLKVIAPNVISSLIRLEELYMGNCSIEWEVERANSKRSNASLDELMHLPRLTTLEIDVKNESMLPEGFLARKLERFKIHIGNGLFTHPMIAGQNWFKSRQHFLIDRDRKISRALKLKLDFMDICSMKLQGINNVECLWLDKLQGIENVLFNLDTEGFSQLKILWVQNNPDFFCIVDSREMVACDAFPLLESLILHNLINMERICVDRLKVESFNELKTVEAYNCDKLSNIFWLSTSKCLPRLERIAVINCSKMKEIFAIGEEVDNAIEKIEFAQLRSLSLGNLPEVTSFCRREVETPSASPNRQVSQEESTTMYCSSEITLDISTLLFNEKVALPNLEALEISDINVDKIWHYNQIPAAMFPHFQSLTRLVVWWCHKLKYIFSASMIGSLKQLQHLDIRDCKDLQEIISENRADQVIPHFVFPQLTTLMLHDLPKLRFLYPGMHTWEWPALETLVVYGCDKLKIFAADLSQNNGNDQLGIPAQQPLLPLEKIVPNLKELSLSGKDVKMILQADFPQHLFGSLRRLEIAADDSACFPIWNVLERFHNLEMLSLLFFPSHEELFSMEGCLEKHAGKLAMIKELQLYWHYHLEQLCKQDSKLGPIFQYLESLKVFHCQSLLILLPSSSVSFGNLTKLVAFGCKELIRLVTSSTAKTLVRLVAIEIYGCRAMTEVVTNDKDGVEKEEIVFRKLKTLELFDLDSLTSFCSANYTFKYPSLQDLHVIGCPKMKIFTTGESITPPRVNVWYGETEDRLLWTNNDLNTTIQQLHAEKLLAVQSVISTHY